MAAMSNVVNKMTDQPPVIIEPAPIVISSSQHLHPQQTQTTMVHNLTDPFMTAAKKPLTLHQSASAQTMKLAQESENKAQYQDFHTYLQSVTKSRNSALEYTLNDHSEDNIQPMPVNPTDRILEGQVVAPTAQMVQHQPAHAQSVSAQTNSFEERKIVPVQSSMIASKISRPASQSRNDNSRLLSAHILESEVQPQPVLRSLPPKPVSSKDSQKQREVSRNRLPPDEVHRISNSFGPQKAVVQEGSSTQSVHLMQPVPQMSFHENISFAQQVYPVASPLKNINLETNPPTLQRMDALVHDDHVIQNCQVSQSQENTARFYQSGLEESSRTQGHSSLSQQIIQKSHLTETVQPAKFVGEMVQKPQTSVKIEPVLLPTLCIAPKPAPKRQVNVSQERKEPAQVARGPGVSYSRKESDTENLKQASQRSSSSLGQVQSPVSEHTVTRTVVQAEHTTRQAAPQLAPEKYHLAGDIPIIENRPYIFDEKGNKIYVDPSNLGQYVKIARRAPEGALIHQLPPTKAPSVISDGNLSRASNPSLQSQPARMQQSGQNSVQKSSIMPGSTAVVTINGVQTAVRYTQTDDGKIIAIPISSSNPNGHITENIRQSMHKPVVVQKGPVIEHVQHNPAPVKTHQAETTESKAIVIHHDSDYKVKRHKSKRDKSGKSRRYRSDHHVGQSTMRIEDYAPIQAKKMAPPQMTTLPEADEEYSYSGRSRSMSRNSSRSRSKSSRRGSKYMSSDPNYKPLKIAEGPVKPEAFYSSTSNFGSQPYSSANFYSSNTPYGMKPMDSR